MEHRSPVYEKSIKQRRRVASFINGALKAAANLTASPEEDFELRDYQLDAWHALWTAREEGELSALVTLATGLGKTSVAALDVLKFRSELNELEGREPRVLFVCHQEKILEQAAERFLKFLPDLRQGYFTGTVKELDADVVFGTFQSLEKHLEEFDPLEFDYIIYDEAHHSQADTWRRVVKYFNPDFQLALTATPDRMDGLEILDLFGREVYAKGLGEALAEGLLADIDYHIVFDEAVKEALEAGFHPTSLRELRDLLSVPRRNEVIAKNIKEEMHRIGADESKTIIFCSDIAHAQKMAKLLGGRAYHSGLKRGELQETLEMFRDGSLQIICAVDMFNEGIDIPDANLLVFLRSTQSKTVFEQQLGRGLRKHPGKERVSVLDFVGNIRRLQELLDLSNSITSLTTDSELDQIVSDGDRPRDIRIHVGTNHTNFDFDRLAIDLLDVYHQLAAEPAPEGYVSVDAFAHELGIAYSTLKQIIAHHQIETGRHQFYSSIGTSLSPEAQAYIKALGDFVPQAPEGYVSAHIFAKEFGMTAPTLLREIQPFNIPVETYRHGTITTISLSPQAQQIIRETVPLLTSAPEGYKSVQAFANELGISHRYLTNVIKTNDIPTERHRFNTNPGVSLSPASQARLKELDIVGEPMPEGYMSVTAFAKHLKADYQTIKKRVEELEITLSRHTTGSGFAWTLSPEDQDLIRRTYYPDLPVAPEGYVTVRYFKTALGIGQATLYKIAEENGIEIQNMTFGKTRSTWVLSPESQLRLRELVPEVEPAPEGYVSVSSFAPQLKTALPTLLKVIEENGIETKEYLFRTQRVLGLSPEAQEAIREIYNQMVQPAPEGYVSLTPFARANQTSTSRLRQLLSEVGIEPGLYRFGTSQVGEGLSPQEQEKLREKLRETPVAPEDYISVDSFAKRIGSHWSIVKKIIDDNNFEVEKYRSQRGKMAEFLSPETQRLIEDLMSERERASAPEGYVTFTEFARSHTIGTATLRQFAESAGVVLREYRFTKSLALGISPDDQQKLTDIINEKIARPAPEGYISVGAFARRMHSARPTVMKLIEENGITPETFRFGVKSNLGLSPRDQETLTRLINNRKL